MYVCKYVCRITCMPASVNFHLQYLHLKKTTFTDCIGIAIFYYLRPSTSINYVYTTVFLLTMPTRVYFYY